MVFPGPEGPGHIEAYVSVSVSMVASTFRAQRGPATLKLRLAPSGRVSIIRFPGPEGPGHIEARHGPWP